MTKQEYLYYLNSEYWQNFRLKVLEYYHYRCAYCKSYNNLEVHHKHYKTLGNETFSDVILLCHWCHNNEHTK